ncbi:cytochrome P450 [Auriscalpium vulgare]|uniref:Cytochrome P450 n=1 Tax=Auriscalpium vulgare TaxID=40419 RepID=A0ACB8RNG1_9AGAM|nr:cytochrome P450 [Auriscalpium vulgare]
MLLGYEPFAPSAVLTIVFLVSLARLFRQRYMLWHIPSVGFAAPFLTYLTALRFKRGSHQLIQEGYDKYKPGLFKIPLWNHWLVMATSPRLIEDIQKATDDVLSQSDAFHYFFQTKYSVGEDLLDNNYHTRVIQGQLTRHIAATLDELREEVVMAIDRAIPSGDDGWIRVSGVRKLMSGIIARTSNRRFVGVPLCRNEGYHQVNVDFAAAFGENGKRLNNFPGFLRPLVASMYPRTDAHIRSQMKIIQPLVEERWRNRKEFGDNWNGKPDNLLMWLMDEARVEGVEPTLWDLARRVCIANFVSILTTAVSCTHALYELADHRDYVEPLRQEIEAAVAEDGWTKRALQKMRKLDSFLRESQRMHGIHVLTLKRFARKPFTFSDGTTIPAGTLVACASRALHRDNETYSDGDVFNGFRFSSIRDKEGQSTKHQMVVTDKDYLAFGLGRHACPGRFFAANMLQLIVAHILVTYDVKFPDGQSMPSDMFLAEACFPGDGDLLFRKRQEQLAFLATS